MLAMFVCIGLNALAQKSSYIQKETDERNNITFVRFSTDTAVQPLSKAADLLKSLYSARREDEMKLSEKRQPVTDEQGYIHQFYQQYHKGFKV
jgi:hypothetical protein